MPCVGNPTLKTTGTPPAPSSDPHAWLDPIIAEQRRIQRQWGITPALLASAAEAGVSEMDEFRIRLRR